MPFLKLARERQYDLMQAFYASLTGFLTVYAARELNIPSIVSIRGNDIIRDVFHTERFPKLKWALEKHYSIHRCQPGGFAKGTHSECFSE